MMQDIFQTFPANGNTIKIQMIYWYWSIDNKIIRFDFYACWRTINYFVGIDIVIVYMWDEDFLCHFPKGWASNMPYEESVRPCQAENRSYPELPFTNHAWFIRTSNEYGFASYCGFLLRKVHLFVLVPETKGNTRKARKCFVLYYFYIYVG